MKPMPSITETELEDGGVDDGTNLNINEVGDLYNDENDDGPSSIDSIEENSDALRNDSEMEAEDELSNGQMEKKERRVMLKVPSKDGDGDEEHTVQPSSKVRRFKQMNNNLKMSANNLNQVLPIEYPKDFSVVWRNINYHVKLFVKTNFRLDTKQILHNNNGHFSSGQVTAIMGPSGAGKSTLLEIVAGRRRIGLTGDVKLKDIKKVRIAFVPQNNYLMGSLTISETMEYAARLQNIERGSSYDSRANVDKLIKMFGMELIRNTQVDRCSGGQQKRLSICLELFQNPNILILDEPTTGLDSASCSLVMKLLKELADSPEYPMAITITIHQPAWHLFTQIDHVYIMTKGGECLFTGPPNKLLPTLEKVNLFCDEFNSPPDYIIEIAAGDYGPEPIEKLQELLEEGTDETEDMEELPNLRESRINRKVPFWSSFAILMQRAGTIYKRNMVINVVRLFSLVLITIWLQLMFGSEIGKVSGCAMRKMELYATPIDKFSTLFEESILMVAQNSCCLFFGLMVGLISGLTAVVLEFPKDMHILMKEYNNGWYSCFSYFLCKSLIDVPMMILMPSIYVLYIYEFTSQPNQLFREGYLLYITIIVGFASESIGAICSAIFMDNPMAAAVSAGAVPLPMTLFGGFLVKYSRMPFYMQFASWFSLLKYAFEGIMVTMYGFNRCEYNYQEFLKTVNVSEIVKPVWARFMPMILTVLSNDENQGDGSEEDDDQQVIDRIYSMTFHAVNKDTTEVNLERSLILSYYELYEDNVLYFSLGAMTLYYIILKIMTYFVLMAKLHSVK